jgi:hypothetical protein
MLKYLVFLALAATMLSASTASAAPITAEQCASQSAKVSVRAVAIAPGETITLFQTMDGTYQGQGIIEVYCRATNGASLGEIPDAKVKISIDPKLAGVTPDMFDISGVNGVPVTDAGSTSGNPVVLGPFTGQATFLITSPSNMLAPGIVSERVGVDFQIVTAAWDAPLKDPASGRILEPGTFGDIMAQTPELDSLALFGTGAVGMLGYGLTRLRAARSRRQD